MSKRVIELLLPLMMCLSALAQVPVKGSTVDATQGFTVASAAPSGQMLCGNGTAFLPSLVCGTQIVRVCNGNGCYVQLQDGTLFQWGTAAPCGASANDCTVPVTFPHAFTVTPVTSVSCADVNLNPSNGNCVAMGENIGTSGFTVRYGAMAYEGGGGFSLTGTQQGQWYAFGY